MLGVGRTVLARSAVQNASQERRNLHVLVDQIKKILPPALPKEFILGSRILSQAKARYDFQKIGEHRKKAVGVFQTLSQEDKRLLEEYRRGNVGILSNLPAKLKIFNATPKPTFMTNTAPTSQDIKLSNDFSTLIKKFPEVAPDVPIMRHMTLGPTHLLAFVKLMVNLNPRIIPTPNPTSWTYDPRTACPSLEYHLGNVQLVIRENSGAAVFPLTYESEAIIYPRGDTFRMQEVTVYHSSSEKVDKIVFYFEQNKI